MFETTNKFLIIDGLTLEGQSKFWTNPIVMDDHFSTESYGSYGDLGIPHFKKFPDLPQYMEVSWNKGNPKSSILIDGIALCKPSILGYPPIYGTHHVNIFFLSP